MNFQSPCFIVVFVSVSEQHVLLHNLHGNDGVHTATPGGVSRVYSSVISAQGPTGVWGDNHRVPVYSELSSPFCL